jgi:hypothetical protein
MEVIGPPFLPVAATWRLTPATELSAAVEPVAACADTTTGTAAADLVASLVFVIPLGSFVEYLPTAPVTSPGSPARSRHHDTDRRARSSDVEHASTVASVGRSSVAG